MFNSYVCYLILLGEFFVGNLQLSMALPRHGDSNPKEILIYSKIQKLFHLPYFIKILNFYISLSGSQINSVAVFSFHIYLIGIKIENYYFIFLVYIAEINF